MKRHTGYGWLELIEGILLIILGALAIASPGGILRWITIFYGVMAIVTGITDIIFYAKSERYIGFAPCVSLAMLQPVRLCADRSGADGISAHRRTGCNIAASAMVYRTQRIEAVSSWIYPEFVQRKVFLCLTGHQCDWSGSRCADDILAAFIFCLLLNLLSACIPAWRASRMNITDALNQR